MKITFEPRVTALAAALGLAFSGNAAAQAASVCVPATPPAVGSVCTITSNADNPVGVPTVPGSLRDAISIANSCGCSGPYTVRFAFAGLTTIALQQPLILSNCAVTIDGYDQSPTPATGATPNTIADIRSGTNAQPRIIIDGSAVSGALLVVQAQNTGVKGLVFQNYGTTAIRVQAPNVSILGNHIGTNPNATACAGAGVNGIGIEATFGGNPFAVGGPNAADRNVIGCSSGSNPGIEVTSSLGDITGNLIGTGAGSAALPNGVGVRLSPPTGGDINVGFPSPGLGNLIARNAGPGVVVYGNGTGAYVQGNDIFLNGGLGIDLDSSGAIPIDGDGPTAPNGSLSPNFSLPNGGINRPQINFVRYDPANTTVDWSYNGFSNRSINLDFHANPAGLGIDEGARWFGTGAGFTTGAGTLSGSTTFVGIQASPTATATATNVGTSEFSPPASLDVNPKFLAFTGNLGVTSAPQTVTFTNLGTTPIAIGPPITTGDFAATSTCDGTTPVPPNGTCTADVTFTPLVVGASSDFLDMPTTGTGGGRGIQLSGNGVAVPVLSPSVPGPIDFGSVRVGTASNPLGITFTNSGTGDLTVATVAIAGAAASSYSILANNCTGAILNTNNPTCTVSLGMQPQAAGTLAASLVITSDATNSPTSIALTGIGLAPVLAANPPGPINFGTVQIGTGSSPVSVSFTNSGNGSLAISGATLAGAAASSFQVLADGCSGQTLTATPATSCTISLAMQPQAAGALSASLQVSSDATNPNLAVALAGTGSTAPVVAPLLTATPAGPVDFGQRRIGTQSPPTTFVLAPASAGSVTISGVSPRGTGFSVVSDTCSGATLVFAGNLPSCSFSVIFAPDFEGTYRTAIQVLSNANNPQLLVEVTGTGTPLPVGLLAASPTSVPFGTQAVGVTTNPQTVLITNSGALPVTVSVVRTTGDYAQTNDCRVLDPGQACRASVTFTPSAQGDRPGNLVVESDATNSPLVVSLLGAGSPAPIPVIELNPGAVSYGTALMGSGGGGTAITLRNVGGANLVLGRIYTVGDFRVTHNCQVNVPPGASCVLTASFVPSLTGPRTGKVVVESNAPAGNKEAPLSGTGCRNFGRGTARLAAPICK